MAPGRIGWDPWTPANGSRCTAGDVLGRGAGSAWTPSAASCPQPHQALGCPPRTHRHPGTTFAVSQTQAFNLCEAGPPRGLSPVPLPAPQYINV